VITVPSDPHHTLFALLASAIFNIPVVSIVLGYPFKYRKYHIELILVQLAWSRIVVFTTRKLGSHYRQLGFIPKLSMVAYSVNPISRGRVRTDISRSAARMVLHLPMEKKIVLTISRYTVFKNLEDFCKVCQKLKRIWADRLLIEMISASGDPKYEAYIKDLIQSIPNSVILDNIPYEMVPLHIRSADCIVLTSKIDNYSRVLLEGLANHVPVVTYDAGLEELRDLSIDQSYGLYTVRTGSIDDLAREINRVLVSAEPVSTHFDLPIFTEQFVKNRILPLLQGLISSGNTPTKHREGL
jgi:glycosyltransferase involved in cell wall biosynthesis